MEMCSGGWTSSFICFLTIQYLRSSASARYPWYGKQQYGSMSERVKSTSSTT